MLAEFQVLMEFELLAMALGLWRQQTRYLVRPAKKKGERGQRSRQYPKARAGACRCADAQAEPEVRPTTRVADARSSSRSYC